MHWSRIFDRRPLLIVFLGALGLTTGCASTPLSHNVLDALVLDNIKLAQTHLDQGRPNEAYQLIQAGTLLDPTHPEIEKFQETVKSDHPAIAMPSALGVNRYARIQTKPGIAKRVFFYIPDRVLDLLDIFGLDLHLGPGIYFNYHLTRALQIGGGARGVAGLGWHTKRSLGLLARAEAGLNFIAAGAQTYSAAQVGTSGLQAGAFNQAGLHRPTDAVYQQMRDYWALGIDTTLLLFGVSFDIHPVELVDFVAGFFFNDFLNDDLSHTKGLKFSNADKHNIRKIAESVKANHKAILDYQETKRLER